MRTEKEIREESRRIRERAKSLSGFWVAEFAAAAAALEWTLGKSPRPPSEDVGSKDSAGGKIAASLLKAAEKVAADSKKTGPKAVPKPEPKPAPARGPAKKRV
jgi:hypothetical protein